MANNLFICETCGGVEPNGCLKCPDRGKGNGVTVQQIKDALRLCDKIADLAECRQHYSRHIATLKRAQPSARTMAIQIENLVGYRRMSIRGDLG